MSNPGAANLTPITSTRQLVEYVASGARPRSQWRIGTEHEKFGFRHGTLAAPAYQGGIEDVLLAHAARGWAPIRDQGHIIGGEKDGASLSLEPGGQFELSGAQTETLHQTKAELDAHLAEARAVGDRLGIGWAPLGFHPLARREDMPWMPKGRYAIMRRYMKLKGALGLDMMLRTCTVQVNLDFASEADMVEKYRLSLALQPVATALFANGPLTEGRPNGFQTFRAQVWTDTDPDRTGIPDVAFDLGFGFERYVDWLLNVPMYFVFRAGRYFDVAGASFRDFMAGRLHNETGGAVATVGDFADHMTTVFTDVRLKRFLEMRGADAGNPAMLMALPALWVGLLYDDAAQKAASALVRNSQCQDFQSLRGSVPRLGLDTPWCNGTVMDLAREVVAISTQGLRARGLGEEVFLAPLQEIVAGAPTQAQHWLARFHGDWGGDATRIFTEAAI
jgi:glutamate--cysteine ligase